MPDPEPLVTRDACDSPWEWLYYRYRRTERRWAREFDSTPSWLLTDLLARPDPETRRAKATDALDGVPSGAIDDALALRRDIAEEAGMDDWAGRLFYDTSTPYDDAYHAALGIELDRRWERGFDVFYRGVRTAEWSFQPSLYHVGDDLDENLDRLRAFVKRLDGILNRGSVDQYGPDELVAVAQHYRGALPDDAAPVGTWLLDVTMNPLVALFMASFSERRTEGETGVVYRFDRNWLTDELPFTDEEQGFRLVVPAGIPRIYRQEAAFLEVHPVVLNQYAPRRLSFRQREDLRFEDPSLGITEADLFPSNDTIAREVRNVRPRPSASPATGTDTHPVTPPFDLAVDGRSLHQAMVVEMVADVGREWDSLSERQQAAFHYLACVQAFLQEQEFEQTWTAPDSINRLRDAVEDLLFRLDEGEPELPKQVERAIRSTLDWRLDDIEDDVSVRSVLDGVERMYDPEFRVVGDDDA